nr:TniB family NTP-binding protein [Nocardia arizonensis]
MRRIIHHGTKLVINNRGKQLGRRGLLVSGASGTSKSTSITQLGKRFQIDLERRYPPDPDRIPVVYIEIPPDAHPKALAQEMAAFLGLPVGRTDNPQAVAHNVAEVMRRGRTGMVLVDEIHRLDLTTKNGRNIADQLKWFFDHVGATFVYAGLDLEESNLFSGVRGRQILGRFIPIKTGAFSYRTDADKQDWAKLVATMEHALRLYRHKPGTLIEQAPYLHARTGGMIGSLDQLVYEAANDAISDSTERITKKHLDAVLLDGAAIAQFQPHGRRGSGR